MGLLHTGARAFGRGELGAARDLGFAVLQRDVNGQWWDLSPYVRGLSYSNRLPGGFATCTFGLAGTWRSLATRLSALDKIVVLYLGEVAWEGRVEGQPRVSGDEESVAVTALGYSVDLRARHFSFVASSRDTTRWENAYQRSVSYGSSTAGQVANASNYTASSNGDPAIAVSFPEGTAIGTNDDLQLVYEAPSGTVIRRVVFDFGSLNLGAGAIRWRMMAADTLPPSPSDAGWAETVVAYRDATAGSSHNVVLSGTSRRYLMIQVDVQTTHTPAGVNGEQLYWYAFLVGGAINPYTAAPFRPDITTTGLLNDVKPRSVIQAILAAGWGGELSTDDVGMAPSRSPLAEAEWPTPVTFEQMLNDMMLFEGYEWGVFHDRRLWVSALEAFHTASVYRLAAIGATPQVDYWYVLRKDEGGSYSIDPSIENVVNRVVIRYTDLAGKAQEYVEERFGDPANPLNSGVPTSPRTIRDVLVDLPNPTTATTAAAAAATVFADRGRPTVKGSIVLPLGLLKARVRGGWATHASGGFGAAGQNTTNSPPWTRPAPLALAGEWVHVQDGDGLPGRGAASPGSPNTYSPIGVLPIREVSVDADAGRVTLSVDQTRDRLANVLRRIERGVPV